MYYSELAEKLMRISLLRKRPRLGIEGFNRGEMGTLLFLVLVNDHVNAGEISKNLELTSGRTAIVLKSLENKGMIIRQRSEEDARVTIVSSTEKAQAFVAERHQVVKENVTKLLQYLGKEDAEAYVRLQKKVFDYHEKEKEDEK